MALYAGITFGLTESLGDTRLPNPQPHVLSRGTIGGWVSGRTIFQSSSPSLGKSQSLSGANPKITHNLNKGAAAEYPLPSGVNPKITHNLSKGTAAGIFQSSLQAIVKSISLSGANPKIINNLNKGAAAGLPANPLITQKLTKGVLYNVWYPGTSTFPSSEIKLKRKSADTIVASQIGQRYKTGTLSGWASGQTTFLSAEKKIAKGNATIQTSNAKITSLLSKGIAPNTTANPLITAFIKKATFGNTFQSADKSLIKGHPQLQLFNPLINHLFLTAYTPTPGATISREIKYLTGTLGGWASGQTKFQSLEKKSEKGLAAIQYSNPQITMRITEALAMGLPANPLMSSLINKAAFGNTFQNRERNLIRGHPQVELSNPLINNLYAKGSPYSSAINLAVEIMLNKGMAHSFLEHPLISPSLNEGTFGNTFQSIEKKSAKGQAAIQTYNPQITARITEAKAIGLTANPLISSLLNRGIFGNTFSGIERILMKGTPLSLSCNPVMNKFLITGNVLTIIYGTELMLVKSRFSAQVANPLFASKISKGAPPYMITNPSINNVLSKGSLSNVFTGNERAISKSQESMTANPSINNAIGKGSMSKIFTSNERAVSRSQKPTQIPAPNPIISPYLSRASFGCIFTGNERQPIRSKVPAGITNPIISHAIISAYWGELPTPRKNIYIYYGNKAAMTESDWSKVNPNLPELSGILGGMETQHLTTGKLLVEHPAIKRIEFYDKNDALVAQIDGLSDFSAGRIIKRVKHDLNLQAAVSYIRVITAADKAQTFYI